MLKNIVKTSYKDMSRAEWLSFRKNSIGGSDAAAIIGLSNWATPFSVWADKLGKTEDREDSEAMRIGRDLEDYVAKRWCEATGKKVRRENNFLVNPNYPWAHATVDRLVIGEDAGLECKTTSRLNLKRFKGVEFPEEYYAQCVHYLAVTGCKKWYLAVLVLGQGLFVYELERDEDEINALMVEEAHFWEGFVVPGIAPPVDGLAPTTNVLSEIYSEGGGGEAVDLMPYDRTIEQYLSVCDEIDALTKQKDELSNKVKNYLGNAEGGSSERFRVTWRSATRSSFDSKLYAKENPHIDLSKYYKTTRYRTFKVSEIQN